MKRHFRILALVAVLGVVAAACGGGGNETTKGGTPSSGALQSGGTLKFAISADIQSAWDPAKEYEQLAWGIYQCCLVRTLMNFNGLDIDQGGNEPVPDLAEAAPDVSNDSLTWTFHLQQGLHYAPPFQDTEITAADFVRAIQREANPEASSGGYSFYYNPIEGFEDVYNNNGKGKVTGAVAKDKYTLELHLTEPTGDLPFRFTMPATAPIPEDAVGADATDHVQDYGRFLVSSGPYMFEGSDKLDFSGPADNQTPVSGYQPGRAWLLVRNPTWVAEKDSDDLRPAYADKIQVQIGGTTEDNFRKTEAGVNDLVLDGVPPPETLQKYSTDPSLKSLLQIHPTAGIRYLAMNMGVPPFDDLHVRKAVNWVIDKDGLRRARGGPTAGVIAGHMIPNILENNLLENYDAFPTPGGAGSAAKAKEEMAQSKYDSNKDGLCDDPVCEGVLMITDNESPYPEQNAIIQDNLSKIGIKVTVRSGDRYEFMYAKCQDPATLTAFCPSVGWFMDYPDASTFGIPLWNSDGIGSSNYSNLGASSKLLTSDNYPVTDVPSADARIDHCQSIPVGDDRVSCWADLDKYLSSEVVPWVPWRDRKSVV